MSGTCGNVVRNVGARKQIVNVELGGHDGRFSTRIQVAGMVRAVVLPVWLSFSTCRACFEISKAWFWRGVRDGTHSHVEM